MFDAAIAFDDDLAFEDLSMEEAEEPGRTALTFRARRGDHRVSMVVTCHESDAPTITSGLLAACWVGERRSARFARVNDG
jgi:hypothetical protein